MSDKSLTWRIGGKVPLNVYEGDRPMFQCHTPEDAARIVALLNLAQIRKTPLTMNTEQEAELGRIANGQFTGIADGRVLEGLRQLLTEVAALREALRASDNNRRYRTIEAILDQIGHKYAVDDESKLLDMIEHLSVEAVEALRATQEDTKRLDWLEQNHIEQFNPPQSPGLYKGLYKYKKIGIDCHEDLTLRQAIDSARNA